jgi:hypothetical protein
MLASIVCLAAPGLARAEKFALPSGTFEIEKPDSWQAAKDLYGMPLTLLGPSELGGRPVVSVTPTGKKNTTLDALSLKRSENEYRAGREEWLKTREGEPVAFFGYRTERLGDVDAHAVGYRYRLGGTEFVENSYFVPCRSQLFHLKTLIRVPEGRSPAGETGENHEVRKILGSFKCQ